MSQGLVILGRVKAGPWELMESLIFLFLSSTCFFKSLASDKVWEISTIVISKSFWESPRVSAVQSILVDNAIASFLRARKVSSKTSRNGIEGAPAAASFEVVHFVY